MGTIAEEITRIQNAKASLKTAIEGKGIVVPNGSLIDAYAPLVASIPKAGWPMAGAELVASADLSFNLKEDTTWDEWTPSGITTEIKNAGPARGSCSYSLTADEMRNYGIILFQFDKVDYRYKTIPTYRYWNLFRSMPKMNVYIPTEMSDGVVEYRPITTVRSFEMYMDNTSNEKGFTGTLTYGLNIASANSISSTLILDGRSIGMASPAITARCGGNFNTEIASCIDSENTILTSCQRIYKVPLENIFLALPFSKILQNNIPDIFDVPVQPDPLAEIDCVPVYADGGNCVINNSVTPGIVTTNSTQARVVATGTGSQATTYGSVGDSPEVNDLKAIKIPNNVGRIQVSINSATIFYNSAESKIVFVKDESAGNPSYPDSIKPISQEIYNIKIQPVRIFDVPSGADAFYFGTRLNKDYTSADLTSAGLAIKFLMTE